MDNGKHSILNVESGNGHPGRLQHSGHIAVMWLHWPNNLPRCNTVAFQGSAWALLPYMVGCSHPKALLPFWASTPSIYGHPSVPFQYPFYYAFWYTFWYTFGTLLVHSWSLLIHFNYTFWYTFVYGFDTLLVTFSTLYIHIIVSCTRNSIQYHRMDETQPLE